MKNERILDEKYNKHILKYFDISLIDKFTDDIKLLVVLGLQYIKIQTILKNKKLRIHVHPKTDLDQRLSIFYICQFLNITVNQIDIIEWDELEVKRTEPFDLVLDIMVDPNYNHKNIIIFDHHNNESINTIEQMRYTINPNIPLNLIDYVDKSYVYGSDIFQPQNIYLLKDFSCEEIHEMFLNNNEFQLLDRFKYKDLYKKWKDRKRKIYKTFELLKSYIENTKYGKIAITFDCVYNGNIIALYHMDCEYYINIRCLTPNTATIAIMTKHGKVIDIDILNWLHTFNEKVYVYPTKEIAMIGSLYSNDTYIHKPWQTVYDSLCEFIGIYNKLKIVA